MCFLLVSYSPFLNAHGCNCIIETLQQESFCFDLKEEIANEDDPQEMEIHFNVDSSATSNNEQTPTKRRASPRKKTSENVNDAIKSILSSLPPPTDDEVRENRNSKSGPLVEIGNSPPAKAEKAAKLFPIFAKGFSENASPNSAKKQALSKRKLPLASTVNEDSTNGLKQSVIDAGQKKFGAEYCLLCDFVYTVGDAEEEKLHNEKHNHAIGIIKFTGWSSRID